MRDLTPVYALSVVVSLLVATVSIAVPFSVLFLPYLVLVALSAYTLIGIVANIDGEVVRQRLIGLARASTARAILAGLAVLIVTRQTG